MAIACSTSFSSLAICSVSRRSRWLPLRSSATSVWPVCDLHIVGVGCINCDARILALVLAAREATALAAAFLWALVLLAGKPWLLGAVTVAAV